MAWSRTKTYAPRSSLPSGKQARVWYLSPRIVGTGLLAVVFCSLVAANLPVMRVKTVSVNGVVAILPSDVEEEVRKNILGSWFFVMPKDFYLAVSLAVLKERIQERFPQILEARVEKKFPDELAVFVREREVWGVYCSSEESRVLHRCFYLDGRGIAYESLSYFEGSILPIIYGVKEPELGSAFLPEATLRYFEDAEENLPLMDAELFSMRLGTSTESDVQLETEEGWNILVNLGRPVAEWAPILGAVLEKDIGASRSRLDYVDLRFGNKVFYKLKK